MNANEIDDLPLGDMKAITDFIVRIHSKLLSSGMMHQMENGMPV